MWEHNSHFFLGSQSDSIDSVIELQSTQGVSFQKSSKNKYKILPSFAVLNYTHCKHLFPLLKCSCWEFPLIIKNAEVHVRVHQLDKALGESEYS